MSWPYAWSEVKKRFPEANYKVYEMENGCIYFTDECAAAQANSRTKTCKEKGLDSRDGEAPLGLIVIDYLRI